jgi:hypothetical protein
MMSRKIHTAIFAVVVTSLTITALFNYRGRTPAAPTPPAAAAELLGLLPASDGIAYVDGQRAVSEILPRVFANQSNSLARINQEMDKFRDDTGTDPRQFDSVAVAVRFKKGGNVSTEFVMGLVRGRFSASEAIANGLAKAKTNAKRPVQYKEEQYEGTTLYSLERTGGFCLAAFDANTIAFGDAAGIRAALSARSGQGARVDSSLVELATLNAGAVAGFAANVPPSAAQSIAASDEFGKAFASVTQIYGSVDAAATTGTATVSLRSGTSEQAQALAEKLSSLKQLAGFYLAQNDSARTDGQAGTLAATPDGAAQAQTAVRSLPFFAKWVKDVTITAEGNDVRLRLEEPLTDLAAIFAGR